MLNYIVDTATGRFISGGPCEVPYDPLTQLCVRRATHVDARLYRYDAAADTGTRPATQSEIDAYDALKLEAAASDAVTDKKLIAVAEFYRQQLNVVRAALPSPLPTITRTSALDAIKTIWKAL